MNQKPKPSWPDPMAYAVYLKIRRWLTSYEQGIPVNPRTMPHPRYGEDQPILIISRYKHSIPFRLNELAWLSEVLNYADSKHPSAIVIAQGRKQHEKLQDLKRIAETSEYSQDYDFSKDDVNWIFSVLGRLWQGRLTSEEEVKDEKEKIASGNW